MRYGAYVTLRHDVRDLGTGKRGFALIMKNVNQFMQVRLPGRCQRNYLGTSLN